MHFTCLARRLFLFLPFLLQMACDENVVIGTDTSSSSSSNSSDSSNSTEDGDDDGLSNEVESTFRLSTSKADTDHDGTGDGLEFVGLDGDPLNGNRSPRSSGRSRSLGPAEVRSDQDGDLDGLPDNFETTNQLDADNPDLDADGYSDGLELIATSDPFQSDSRPQRSSAPMSDGETRTGNPPQDSDGDGIADEIEQFNGTFSNSRDSDGDGFSDGIEFLMGSDPLDPTNIPNFTVPTPP